MTTGSPMTWTGTPTLASYDGFSASDPLPDITSASLSGGVGKYDDPTATQVRFLVYIPKAGLADGKVVCAIDQVDYSAGSAQFWELYYSTTDASNSWCCAPAPPTGPSSARSSRTPSTSAAPPLRQRRAAGVRHGHHPADPAERRHDHPRVRGQSTSET
jgi:hypothetical protein